MVGLPAHVFGFGWEYPADIGKAAHEGTNTGGLQAGAGVSVACLRSIDRALFGRATFAGEGAV
jgi:hypothetical protein